MSGFKHRQSEDDSKLEIDVNSPLSDDEDCDEDEDDFKNIKFLIGKNKKSSQEKPPQVRKNNSIS